MRPVRDAWLPALVGLLAAFRFATGACQQDGAGPPERPPDVEAPAASPASEEAPALLEGLTEGDELAGWKVERVESPPDGAIRVRVAKGGVRWTAEIQRKGRGPGPPPRSTDKFDLTYGNVLPEGTLVDPAETFAVLDALVERVRRAEDE